MMPVAMIYALSDERQRAALNKAHAARAASVEPVSFAARTNRRRGVLRVRRVRECLS